MALRSDDNGFRLKLDPLIASFPDLSLSALSWRHPTAHLETTCDTHTSPHIASCTCHPATCRSSPPLDHDLLARTMNSRSASWSRDPQPVRRPLTSRVSFAVSNVDEAEANVEPAQIEEEIAEIKRYEVCAGPGLRPRTRDGLFFCFFVFLLTMDALCRTLRP